MVKNEIQLNNDWNKCEELLKNLNKVNDFKTSFENLWKEETEDDGVFKKSRHCYVYDSRGSLESQLQAFAIDFNRLIADYVMGEES